MSGLIDTSRTAQGLRPGMPTLYNKVHCPVLVLYFNSQAPENFPSHFVEC